MSKTLIAVLVAMPALAQAAPADFPTIDRYLFVNECMQENGGSLDNMYKCSCVMDKLAENLTYAEFQDGDTATHGANTTGERAGLFRDPENIKADARKLATVKAEAQKACNFTPKKR